MEIVYLITTFFAGIAVAFINTISGAGSLFSISAFMFVGMSAAEANATNRIPILVQSFFSAKGFESKGIKGDSYKWWLALACVPGAIAGSLFATKIESHILSRILAGVMLLFLFITLFNPLQQTDDAEERVGKRHKVAGVIIHFFIGLYGGFIQAGSGFFMMAPLMLLNRFSLSKTNYYKVFITMIYTLAALGIFIWKGNINWYYGFVAAGGTSVGGWLTSRWSVAVDEIWMKRIMVSLIFLLTVYVWFFK